MNSSKKKIKLTRDNQNDTPSCILIGEDHLVVQCAEVLIASQYKIKSIISPVYSIREWATQNSIPAFKTFTEVEPLSNLSQIDYLFSIVNSKIIPTSVLNKAKKLTINYHHAPLPKYAGVHATSWAIINEEKTHGVSWHVVSEKIDGGDLLKQTTFQIDEHETALSLNYKCAQYALTLFKELVSDLSNNQINRIRQDLSKRTYYGLNRKLRGNGLVNWNESAIVIERYFRALHHGIHDNALGTLKIKIKDHYYIVTELKLSQEISRSAPGSITEINPLFWRIATASTDVILLKLSTIYGKECSLDELVTLHQLKKGVLLEHLTAENTDLFESISAEIGRNEAFWIQEIVHFEPAEIPFANDFLLDQKKSHELLYTYNLSDKSYPHNLPQADYFVYVLTLWLIYLYRLGNKKNLGIYIGNKTVSSEIGALFSTEFPFSIQLQDHTSFEQAFRLINKKIQEIKNNKTFLKDVYYRYSALAGVSHFVPMAVFIDNESHGNKEIVSESIVVLNISVHNKRLEWYLEKNIAKENASLREFIKNSTEHFHTLMVSVLQNPKQLISLLQLLPQSEENKILHEWNNTRIDFPYHEHVGLILDKAFRKHSQRNALQLDYTSLTYNDLKIKVDSLSYYLVTSENIKIQDPVIVYMSRSLEWIVALLAIIKIGGIYIPIEGNTPTKRVKHIINDSKARIILGSQEIIEKLRHSDIHAQLVDLNAMLQSLPHQKCDSPPFMADAIAYILYTSGTTGTPKGVIIKHSNLMNLIYSQILKLKINVDTKVLQFSSIGFDASIWEIFSTLIAGSTLCIPSDKTMLVGPALEEVIRQFEISMVTLPPSILQTIAASRVTTLETVISAGEPCSRELANQWVDDVHLINAYGPTETTVCATMGEIEKQGEINIGTPLPNTQVYVLDDKCNPVPIGVIGELYVGGNAVAVGYLNQPDLTSRYFMKNPFSKNPENRLYNTRDLVRWLPNGSLEYIGRKDHQFKIRGLRIEPEAIEAQILHHHAIAQCVVSLQHSDKLEKFIVAYIVIREKINLHQLRESLSDHLPHYMVPNFFIILDKIPLTTNGKIDRKSLPAPELKWNISDQDYTPPSNDIEKALCKLWGDLLGIDKVGIHNDFFTIGGNSLLLSHLIVTLSEQFKFEIHFSAILKNPTIAALSTLISQKIEIQIDEECHQQIVEDLNLSTAIKPIKRHSNYECNAILLTGSTGFLGTHLLKELHHLHKMRPIYCLIRSNSDLEAKKILENALAQYGFDLPIGEQIIPISGDLSYPQLGLKNTIYTKLAEEVGEIYHNAAFVHHIYNYEMLRAANVGGTIELVKFAGQYRNKKINYISTLSALSEFTNSNGEVIENFLSTESKILSSNGYNQTKWVSEKILSTAQAQGFTVNIYRPGWILGKNSNNVSTIKSNHFLSLIKGCVQMGSAPNWDIKLNILPVDFLSRMIVKIASSNDFNNRVFNFFNPNTMEWARIFHFLQEYGFPVNLTSNVNWIKSLKKIGHENALFNLLPLYIGPGNNMESSLNKIKSCEDNNVKQALTVFNESYPVIDKVMLSEFLKYLK